MNESIFQLSKLAKNQVIFFKILARNRADWYMNGSRFLGKLVFVWIQFRIPSGTSLPKPNLTHLPPPNFVSAHLQGRFQFKLEPLAYCVAYMCVLFDWIMSQNCLHHEIKRLFDCLEHRHDKYMLLTHDKRV